MLQEILSSSALELDSLVNVRCAGSVERIEPQPQQSESPDAPKAEDRLMDLEEVTELLGHVSTRSVRRLIAKGDLPKPVKVLNSPRLYHSNVRRN